ncbi:hypothetical protein [Deinococcus cellulosilyticus]|nr:hypothetical protein [Deinococcus cellulosilyticus]
MKSEKETPEEFDEIEPENVFDGEGVVFHPQLIWQDLQKVQRQIDHHLDDLPMWYSFQVQMADAEQPVSTSWCWMVRQGELWGFDGGWNCCEGTPTEIRFYDPNQPPDPRFHRTYPDFAAFPDPARKIHGWDFPEGGLSGYVLGRAAHVMDAARLQHLAFEREKQQDLQDRIWMQSQSYEDVFKYQLESLAHVCRFALEHDCFILVDHSV